MSVALCLPIVFLPTCNTAAASKTWHFNLLACFSSRQKWCLRSAYPTEQEVEKKNVIWTQIFFRIYSTCYWILTLYLQQCSGLNKHSLSRKHIKNSFGSWIAFFWTSYFIGPQCLLGNLYNRWKRLRALYACKSFFQVAD